MDVDHKMEHRWSLRKPVEIDVTLRRQGLFHKRYKTKNISLEGVFVESGQDSWPEDTFLELELPADDKRREAGHAIPVVVVHRSGEGMGLMFCVFDQQLFKIVEHLLYDSPSNAYADMNMRWRGKRANLI
jgi:hypothetical protein